MKNNIVTSVLIIALYITLFYGYIANIYKLSKCDFDTPLKSEVIRGIGVVVPPIGIVVGFIDIKDVK